MQKLKIALPDEFFTSLQNFPTMSPCGNFLAIGSIQLRRKGKKHIKVTAITLFFRHNSSWCNFRYHVFQSHDELIDVQASVKAFINDSYAEFRKSA